MRVIAVQGNPIDGFAYIGPFGSEESAVEYAESNLHSGDWWVVGLDEPEMAGDAAKGGE